MNTNSVYPAATNSGLDDASENTSPCGFPLCAAFVQEEKPEAFSGLNR
ncbi:hypothetical protein LMG27174_01621 [Paraburkholderia rhynchosiae]|uniref:Uncharacterized protein n=1 Tax=Paraburkholderia rhynchosiae TaxID=487049 RepID=A0A6J5AAH2_9BURK|nr:hypothetical protein LMG27174_01621 [Paraburkholderia rhynchosiae]